ncbi:MAG: hypothetical protein QF578_09670 [Alphaproteobacteria bacterium]|jgi:hydrogenase/urease accessory protein HupE|nr:hypothetical protein [Alphaproteobacteria bacterium]MDP6565082.1 hypothetical protein [Alphaproteobacteria bacterium]MDP6813258.1 hypothetical protein [Alphaproteobacteria bacterium]
MKKRISGIATLVGANLFTAAPVLAHGGDGGHGTVHGAQHLLAGYDHLALTLALAFAAVAVGLGVGRLLRHRSGTRPARSD